MRALPWLLLSACQLVFPLRDRDAGSGDGPSADGVPDDSPIGSGCTSDPDLLACFQFDGNVEDLTGRNHVQADATGFAAGVEGQAASTNVNSTLDFVAPALQADTELTIEAWIRLAPDSTGEQYVIDLDGCWAISVTSTLAVECHAGSLSVVSASAISRDQWTHVACTQVDQAITLFVDGLVAGTANQDPIFTGCTTAALARNVTSVPSQRATFVGQLDRMRLYNRLLDPADIALEVNTFRP